MTEKYLTPLIEKTIEELTARGKSKKEASQIAKQRFVRMWAVQPQAINIYVDENFEKISCGYHLLIRNENLSKNFMDLEKWFISYLKKCDWLIIEYLRSIEMELERRMAQYGQMWAIHDYLG